MNRGLAQCTFSGAQALHPRCVHFVSILACRRRRRPAVRCDYAQLHAGSLPRTLAIPAYHAVHGLTYTSGALYYATICCLSVTLAAVFYTFFAHLSELLHLQHIQAAPAQKRQILHGVDVTHSAYFKDSRVLAAVDFAAKAHRGQFRKTGEPYVAHCIETALIVERNLPRNRRDDSHLKAVMAAILHDVPDDTSTDLAAITFAFGEGVASRVAKVSKLSQVNQVLRRGKRQGTIRSDQSLWSTQRSQLKSMMVDAAFQEPLVILIKLADRLHNMRTCYALQPEKQVAVAEETLEVWRSMASYLGWDGIKSEMEDLCFAVLDPEQYCSLRLELDKMWDVRSLPPASLPTLPTLLPAFVPAVAHSHAADASGAGPSSRSNNTLEGTFAGKSRNTNNFTSSSNTSSSSSSSSSSTQVSNSSSTASSKAAYFSDRAARLAAASEALSAAVQSQGPPSQLQPRKFQWLFGNPTPQQPPVPAAATAAVESSASSGAATDLPAAVAATAGGAGSSTPSLQPQLSVQQRQLQRILLTTVPFSAVSFTSAQGLAWSTRRGLEVLDECANTLYNEINALSYSAGLSITIQGRLKSLYSVHKKMQRKQCSAREVYDARALRVIVEDSDPGDDPAGTPDLKQAAINCCYRLMATVQTLWRPVHREFDDYIANPKPSGYQALHTAVRGPRGVPMEVQIKTASMHEHAEYGGAAHWVYKEIAAGEGAGDGGDALLGDGFAGVRGYEGQPVLRVDKTSLKYGAVVARSEGGRRLVVAIRAGPTFREHPTRVPDYAFYDQLAQYARDRSWTQPAQGDFNARLEEFVHSRDGRFHRCDHMGHVSPSCSLTLLEGYERAAWQKYLERQQQQQQQHQPQLAVAPVGGLGGVLAAAAAAAAAGAAGADDSGGGATAATATAVLDRGLQLATPAAAAIATTAAAAVTASASARPQLAFPPQAAVTVSADDRARLQETYAKTQHLRAMVEWGKDVVGDSPPSLADEVSVLIWPGGEIESFRRGTTAGQIVREKGLTFVTEGGAGGAGLVGRVEYCEHRVVNVNNCLVHEDTVLDDGDLVILTREKLDI